MKQTSILERFYAANETVWQFPVGCPCGRPPQGRAGERAEGKEAEKEKLTTMMIIKKVVVLIVFMFLFAWMLHLAGAKTFIQGLLLTYTYAIALFAWDTFFLDWVLFANIKKIRLPGTEHMDKEYHQKWFHVKVCIPMIPIFAIVGVLSALIMIWIW